MQPKESIPSFHNLIVMLSQGQGVYGLKKMAYAENSPQLELGKQPGSFHTVPEMKARMPGQRDKRKA